MSSKRAPKLKIASILSHDTHQEHKFLEPHTTPLFLSSTYLYGEAAQARAVFAGEAEAYIYSRWSHPNAEQVEQKLALLESRGKALGYQSLVYNSGMAAIAAVFDTFCGPGTRILVQGNIYGTTADFLIKQQEKRNWELVFFNPSETSKAAELFHGTRKVSAVYLETPANPTLDVYDIGFWAKAAAKQGAKLLVDNTFATSVFQQPLMLGAQVSIQSTTKYLNGHGTALGGVVSVKEAAHAQALREQRKLFGSIQSPFDSWLLNNGLKTLLLRLEKHQSNALRLAQFLSRHPRVAKVNYPGLKTHPAHALAAKQMSGYGGVLSFEIKGGRRAVDRFLKKVTLCRFTASLGTPDTLVQHPATMSHVFMPAAQRKAFGITDALIRLSVGMEDAGDLTEDLRGALE